ncbi:hypothetical protein [Paracidovorax citrulli]
MPIFQQMMLPPQLQSIVTTEAMQSVLDTLADTFAADGRGSELTVATLDGQVVSLSQEARDYAARLHDYFPESRRRLVGAFLLDRLRQAMLPAFCGKGRASRSPQEAHGMALQAAAVLGQQCYLDMERARLARHPDVFGNAVVNSERVAVRVEDGAVAIEKSLGLDVPAAAPDQRYREPGRPVRLGTAIILTGEGERLVASPAYVKVSGAADGGESTVVPEFAQSWLQDLIDALHRLLFGAVHVQPGSVRVTAEGVVFEPAAPATEAGEGQPDMVALYKAGLFGAAPRSVMTVAPAEVALPMWPAPRTASGASSHVAPAEAAGPAAEATRPEATRPAAETAAITPAARTGEVLVSAAAAPRVPARSRTSRQPFQYSVSYRADEGVLGERAQTVAQGVLSKSREDEAEPGKLAKLVARDFVGGIAQSTFPVTFDGVDLLDQSSSREAYRLLRARSRAGLLGETEKATRLESELRIAMQADPEWRATAASATSVSEAAQALLSDRFLREVARRYPDPETHRAVLWACTQCATLEPCAWFDGNVRQWLADKAHFIGTSNGKLSERAVDIRADGTSLVVEITYEQSCDRMVRQDGSDLPVDPVRNRIRYFATVRLEPGRVVETSAVLMAGYDIEVRDAIRTAATPPKASGLWNSWVWL